MSIPNSRSGRSRTWPMQVFTTNLEPRILLMVLALAGDSTMTSDLPDPPFFGLGDFSGASGEESPSFFTFDFLGMSGGGVCPALFSNSRPGPVRPGLPGAQERGHD